MAVVPPYTSPLALIVLVWSIVRLRTGDTRRRQLIALCTISAVVTVAYIAMFLFLVPVGETGN